MNFSPLQAMYRVFIGGAFLFSAAMASSAAHAASITGNLALTGAGGYTMPGATGFSDATAINFNLDTTNIIATGVNGDLASTVTALLTTGTVQDFTFSPLLGSIPGFITIGGWSFQLDAVTVVDQTSGLILNGSGVLTGNSFDATPARWSFSSVNTNDFSMTLAAVPVPAAVWLFGSGLLGLAGAARRKSA